jgi:DeoR/GlpR family transcriptional regulator of sugar metabolism
MTAEYVHSRAVSRSFVHMLATERREWLLARLSRDGRLVATEIAAELGTSEDTIRRDLRDLAAAGRLQRVHGGALPSSPAVANFLTRQSIATDAKAAVARAAAALVESGQTVIVDGGTTALQLVQSLDPTLYATVVTHSPTIAVALVDHAGIDVLILGGQLFKHSVVACGALAAEAAAGVHADTAFIGVTGVHPDAGLTTGDADEAAMKRTLARRAAETYILASSEKIGTVSPHRVLDWADITAVLTDHAADARTVAALRAIGVDVHVAPASRRGRNSERKQSAQLPTTRQP